MEVEQRHYEIIRTMGLWPLDKDNKRDEILIHIMANIVILSADFVPVANKEKVRKTQQMYVVMLQRYLKHKNSKNANARFSQGLMIHSLTQEAAEIMSRRLPV